MKLKTILLALAIFLITGLFIKVKFDQIKINNLQYETDRYKTNWYNAMSDANDNKAYYLKEKDLSASLKAERDNLAEKLKVKPKQIERIVKVETLIIDTVIKEIPVKPILNGWEFTDTINKCTVYKGAVSLTDTGISVKRTGFFDADTITSTYYRKRPHKFLFLRYGKYENFVSTESNCGKAKTEQFNFIK